MSTKNERLQLLRRQYRDETGESELDHRKVAEYAIRKGWRVPQPKTPADILAKELSDAARAEERVDRRTGLPYRANLSFSIQQGAEQLTLWVDTDEASRPQMQKAATQYRNQMVGEAYRLVLTVEHWNRINSGQEPIQVPLDLQPDVDWLRNAPREGGLASRSSSTERQRRFWLSLTAVRASVFGRETAPPCAHSLFWPR